ncbi:MAG: dicarboxylate/amino acid:cation symporter [Bacteroidales bacterium]|nr:dicarboxylate/amino acid:cation symporter [Bacteroidales bacterium]
MKKIKIKKLPMLVHVLIAIVLGIALGYVLPDWITRIFVTFNSFFGQFISFCVPLIILALVSAAIAETSGNAGRMLMLTLGLAYLSTVVAGVASYSAGAWMFPKLITPTETLSMASGESTLIPYFKIMLPPALDVLSALALAFMLGLGITATRANVIKQGLMELRSVIMLVIEKAVVPLLPLYIFGIFLQMSASGEVGSVLNTFMYVIIVIFALHVLWLIFLYVVAGSIARQNPLKLMATMLPAYLTALGTSSSAATIPVTLKQAKKTGASPNIVDFVIPLCANIHLSGSCLKIVACSMALMIMLGQPFSLGLFFGLICLLAITLVAAPGVPGGAIMAALPILESVLGFTPEMQALIISLYIAMDSFGTACNVMGDGALTTIINAVMRHKSTQQLSR